MRRVGTSLFVGKRLFWKTAARSTFFLENEFFGKTWSRSRGSIHYFFCLKNNFLESLGPGFFLLQKKQQLTCGMRGWVGTFLFVINRFFLESWMDAQFFLV